MVAAFAATELIHIPIERRARALLAKVAGERADIEKTDKGEEFTNAVLQWGSRQTPLVVCLQSKACSGTPSCALLYNVS